MAYDDAHVAQKISAAVICERTIIVTKVVIGSRDEGGWNDPIQVLEVIPLFG